jgi:hypothetical protein
MRGWRVHIARRIGGVGGRFVGSADVAQLAEARRLGRRQ